ncbi:MAG: ABC transporter ATP-binding protein [Alphaproteobacteria bacterium]|nr:ABC transporter ATP-binding protein [Alphaproteobacteria bacterium]
MAAAEPAAFALEAITKRYALRGRDVLAIDRLSLACRPGEFVALVGRSGCGKTTLLRTVAGLEQPDGGTFRWGRPGGRPARAAMVFQEPRLMPWLTVRQNVGFGMMDAPDRAGVEQAVARLLELVELSAFADALPHQLSGGMAQRVALARALCLDPDVLLMDEPFGALDAFTRRALQRELVQLWLGAERRRTVLFVTHDVEEAVLLAERVLVMRAGRLVAEVAVPLAYPRRPEDINVVALRERLIDTITESHSNERTLQ